MVAQDPHSHSSIPVFDREALSRLEDLVQAHPWSAYYRAMLAKAMKDQASPNYPHKLELAALYALDRQQLYALLHSGMEVKQTELAEEAEERDPILKEMEKAITYDPTVELKALEIRTPMRQEPEIPLEYTVYDPEVELAKLEAEQAEDSPHDFLYWLNHVDDAPKPAESETSNVDQVHDLLEQFLKSKPRKPLEKRAFFNPQQRAEASETDDSELVSESLTRLYMKQELWDKARAAAQKLSLQNPHRSAYFAALLEEIEEKQKSST